MIVKAEVLEFGITKLPVCVIVIVDVVVSPTCEPALPVTVPISIVDDLYCLTLLAASKTTAFDAIISPAV